VDFTVRFGCSIGGVIRMIPLTRVCQPACGVRQRAWWTVRGHRAQVLGSAWIGVHRRLMNCSWSIRVRAAHEFEPPMTPMNADRLDSPTQRVLGHLGAGFLDKSTSGRCSNVWSGSRASTSRSA